MSTRKYQNVKEILGAIKSAKGFKKNTDLAEWIGTSKQNITNWITRNNIGDFSLFTAVGLSDHFLRTGEGPMFETAHHGTKNVGAAAEITTRIPLISSVQAGAWTSIVDQFQPGDAEEWVPVTKAVSKSAFALRVSGTSMEPDYRPGDIIVVDPDGQAHSGSLVVVRMNSDNEATFKRLMLDGARTYLEPLNARYQPMEITGKDYTICGVVRQMLRDVF